LGNRSLIALANSKEFAHKLSMEVKKREWYRPIAPILLEIVAKQVTVQPMHHLEKYMLLDFNIKPEIQLDLEVVVYANQTARIRTISSENNNPFDAKGNPINNKEFLDLGVSHKNFAIAKDKDG